METKQISKEERLSKVTKPMPTELPVVMELLSNDIVNKSVYILGVNGERHYPVIKQDRYLPTKFTITTSKNRQEVIRYVSGVDTIFLDEQKKVHNIDANYKATYEDKNALKVTQGEIIIDDFTLLEFLWHSPIHDAYQGRRDNGIVPMIRVLEKDKKSKDDVKSNKIKRKMLNKIAEITDEENDFENFDLLHAFGILYKVYGSGYQVLESKEEICLQLQSVAEAAEQTEDLAYITLMETSKDELLTNTDVIVGYALKEGILSLTHNVEEISILNNQGFYETAYVTGSQFADYYEKVPLFTQYLNSAAGLNLLSVLREKVLPKATEKKKLVNQ